MVTKTVKAKRVRKGDYIPGLDNAYVHSTPQRTGYDNNLIVIDMHDCNGEDAMLECWKNMPITIERHEDV